MKFKIRTTVLFLLLIFYLSEWTVTAQNTVPVKTLTFEQALEITNGNSHVLKQNQYLQKEKKQEVKAAKGLYLPKVGISASYMRMSDNLHLDLTQVRDAITPLYQALGNYGNFSGVPNPDPATHQQMPILPDNLSTQAVRGQLLEGLTSVQNGDWDKMIQKKEFGLVAATMQWPIYTGGKIAAANKVAEIQKGEADEVARQKQGELMSELTERYFGLCLARQAVMIRQDVLDGMNKHLDDAIKMEKQGMIANADVLHARVFQAQAEREFSKAKRTQEIVNQSLLNTLAMEEEITLEPSSRLFYLDTIEPLDYFIKNARQNNPLLQQVNSKKKLVMQNYKVEKSEYFPAIALEGMYNIVDKDLSPYTPDWTVGIGLNWTLFDGAARYRKVKAAALKTDQVEEVEQKAQSDIETMINKLYQELNMYREQLVELESSKTFTDEYLRVREKAFHEEMSNATEVVDARLAQSQVRIERLQAMYGYDLALARLLEYAGISSQFPDCQKRLSVKMESYK